MTPRRILFWEPSVSPHKLALVRALVARGHAVTYVAQEGLSAERAAQGWTLGEIADLDIRIAPQRSAIEALVRSDRAETIHVFSGIRHIPIIVTALACVLACGATFALLSEPRVAAGWRGALRRLQSWLTEAEIRRRAAFVLAIGRNGPPWFESVGYARVFAFAYFLPPAPPPSPRPDRPPTIAYLGRLTEAKGIRLFLDAIDLVETPARWLVAGQGDEVARVLAHPRVEYRGALAMEAVPAFLAETDVLVQPSSSKDGWAAVVSEALLAGTRAIATPQVGASILLDDPHLGQVAEATPHAVAAAIALLLVRGEFGDEARRSRAAWADAALTGTAGAEQFDAILSHVLEGSPPPPPFPPAFSAATGAA